MRGRPAGTGRHDLATSVDAGVLFTVPGPVARASGQPFIFPGLGPTAFVPAFERRLDRSQVTGVVASHLIGGVAGLLASTLLASGITLTADPAAFSADGLLLATSGVRSIVLTSAAMIAADAVHAPP